MASVLVAARKEALRRLRAREAELQYEYERAHGGFAVGSPKLYLANQLHRVALRRIALQRLLRERRFGLGR